MTNDRFYFRGNGENTAGDVHRSTSVFPPTYQMVYGALRSNWITQHGNLKDFKAGKYAEIIGTVKEPGDFQLKGIYLAKNGEIYIPLPMDTQIREKNGQYVVKPLMLRKGNGFESDLAQYRFTAQNKGKSKDNQNFWLAISELNALYSNHEVQCLPLSAFVKPEAAIGIALNRETSTVLDRMLYQYSGYYLSEGAELVIDMELANELRYVKFGNKGIVWSIEQAVEYQEQIKQLRQLELDEAANYLRITTLTPSIITGYLFGKGFYRWNDKYRLVQAIIPRKEVLSGWNMAENKPKPKLPVFRPGMTFIVERRTDISLYEQIKELEQIIHSDDQSEAGYGQVMVTTYNPQLEQK